MPTSRFIYGWESSFADTDWIGMFEQPSLGPNRNQKLKVLKHFTVSASKAKYWLFDTASVPSTTKNAGYQLSYCDGAKMTHLGMSTIAGRLPFTPLFMLILWSPLLHQMVYITYHKVKFNHRFQKNHREFSSNRDVPIFPTFPIVGPLFCHTTTIDSSHYRKQTQPSSNPCNRYVWIENIWCTLLLTLNHMSKIKSYSLVFPLTAFPK